MKLTLEQIQSAMGAVGFLGDAEGTVPVGVQTDSRVLKRGELFFCISGERFDGHNFAKAALERGACGIVAERPPFSMEEMMELECGDGGVPLLMVQDCVEALGKLGAFYRLQTKAIVTGITGTAGKTTVKELLAEVLSVRGETARNHLNLNNQIGLPVSMLAASGDEKYWVMEAGISQPHDMDELGAIMRPDLAIILNVGEGHTEGLGDKGVAYYKSQLLKYVQQGGVGLVSADYPELTEACEGKFDEMRYFSIKDPECAYYAEYIGAVSEVHGKYRVNLCGKEFEVTVPFRGEFAAENVIAVAAAADIIGLLSKEIIQGFAQATLPEKRFNCSQRGNWLVIDDCYNSNPLSCARALETAAELAKDKPLVLVLGEMLELGEQAYEAHRDLGKKIAESNADVVCWIGNNRNAVKDGLDETDFTGEFHCVETPQQFLNLCRTLCVDDGAILFKGSRGNKLERFVSVFCDNCCPSRTTGITGAL
ncbi:UDP-N-acetylmuramoyl-tripeptide--D-alanyl-D-alanine ligase [Halodesulfovibrio sp.]|uniref:UDP-N-acetylmuramoyl-tripeptide--D-alanyl-D- alanine ligase n=1 Tax=Halodesulfovibrio sp. TaxID=1912772 RepID=UPI0025C57A07|nr:UDP-N-acetylmuramoyl-tripeptide--D-alanyl-D-alanine ligase [Halodesulfovibrio sp.]